MQFAFDWANRLVAVAVDGVTVATYTYDAFNRRITATTAEGVTRCVYDGSRLIEEYNGRTPAAPPLRAYVYGVGRVPVFSVDAAGTVRYLLTDRQDSVVALTDAAGNVVELYRYTPYGARTACDPSGSELQAPSSALANSFGFTGQRYDAEAGLWDFRNRAYSPELGRFLQRDPAGFVDGYNLYLYCRNSPPNFTDPDGRTARVGGAVAAAGWDLGTDYLAGAYMAWANDNTGGAGYYALEKAGLPLPAESGWATRAGAGLGPQVALGQGAAELVAGLFVGGVGAGVVGSGAGATGTGAGAVLGLPAMAVGAATVAEGVVIGGHGIGVGATAWDNLAHYQSASGGSGNDRPNPNGSIAPDNGGSAGNPVLSSPRTGSALKDDFVKPIRDADGEIIREFPATPKAHGFPDIVDNYATQGTEFTLRNGAKLYQVEGSQNGVLGRFEWIVENGQVTHRMFVEGGKITGVSITP